MIKKIGIVLVSALLVVSVLTLAQPSKYSVEEVILIDASPERVMPLLIDLKEWRKWSPWLEKDPEMLTDYSDLSSGRGASVVWDSKKDGKGKQTITDIVGDEFIKMKLEFYSPNQGVAYSFFRLKENKIDETEVIWLFEYENKTFIEKFFCLFFGIKSMIRTDYKKGLANLKAVVEG